MAGGALSVFGLAASASAGHRWRMQKVAPQIETERLVLRAHQVGDFDAVAAMWSDPEVVRYIGGRASTREESWARLLRYAGSWAMLGFGFWTIRDRSTGGYLGEGGCSRANARSTPDSAPCPKSAGR